MVSSMLYLKNQVVMFKYYNSYIFVRVIRMVHVIMIYGCQHILNFIYVFTIWIHLWCWKWWQMWDFITEYWSTISIHEQKKSCKYNILRYWLRILRLPYYYNCLLVGGEGISLLCTIPPPPTPTHIRSLCFYFFGSSTYWGFISFQ